MGDDSRQEWESFSHRFSPELVALIERHSRDAALAQRVAAEVLRAARSRVEAGGEVPSREALEVVALRLAIRRLQERHLPVPPTLEAGVHARTWPRTAPPRHDPELVAAALDRVPADQRIALDLHYLRDYSIEDAADFFELSRSQFLRLLARARRRLVKEYERLRDGLGAVVGVLTEGALRTRRRAQAGLTRTHGALDQGLARLAQLPVLDALSATATVALVAALTLGGGPVGRTEAQATPAVPVALGTVIALRAAPLLAEPTVPVNPVSAPSAPSQTPDPASPPTEDPGPSASVAGVAPLPPAIPVSEESGLEGRTTYQTESKTVVEVEGDALVPAPEEPSGTLPDEAGVGVDGYVGYHCPPPGERPPPHALACPVLEP